MFLQFTSNISFKTAIKCLLCIIASLALGACGGSSSGSNNNNAPTASSGSLTVKINIGVKMRQKNFGLKVVKAAKDANKEGKKKKK